MLGERRKGRWGVSSMEEGKGAQELFVEGGETRFAAAEVGMAQGNLL